MAGFLKNTSVNFLARILGQIANALALILIARYLGPGRQGEFTSALLFPALVSAFLGFGYNSATVRLLCQGKFSNDDVLGQNLLFGAATSLLGGIAGVLMVLFWGHSLFPGNQAQALFIALATLPALIFSNLLSHFLLGLNQITKFSISSVLAPFFLLLMLALTRLFMPGALTVNSLLALNWLAVSAAAGFTFYWCLPFSRRLALGVNSAYQKVALKFGFIVYLASLIAMLDGAVGLFIINLFLPSAELGQYSVAMRLAEGIWVISITMSTVLFPLSASNKSESDAVRFSCLVCRATFLLTFLAALALWLLAPYLIPLLFSAAYLPAVAPFRILLAGTLAISVWRVLANDLIGRGDPLPVTVIAGISLLVNVIVGCLLIRGYGLIGVAWSAAIVYWIRLMLTAMVYRKKTGISFMDIWLPLPADIAIYGNKLEKVRAYFFPGHSARL